MNFAGCSKLKLHKEKESDTDSAGHICPFLWKLVLSREIIGSSSPLPWAANMSLFPGLQTNKA